MKDYLQTVTGPVAREDMGLTLPHEHLFNDLSSVVDAPCYPFSQRLVDKKVTAETAGSTSGTDPVRGGIAEKPGYNGRGRFGTEKRDGPD